MDSLVGIRVKLKKSVLARLKELAAAFDLSREEFIQTAVDNELKRREVERVRGEIALLEIDRNILAQGQTLSVPVAEAAGASTPATATCELCLAEIPSPPVGVAGPLFCDECLKLAKGGDFSQLEEEA
ncbi:MAG: hypothetical protein IIA14_06420 [SAR324 cluster bacterium]|nr:hypothetical protein [SAR324 cluster bacterium]